MGPQTVAKLGLPLQQRSPPSESPQVGWQQVSWMQLALIPQQNPEAHWSPPVQVAPKPPVLPEELPDEAELLPLVLPELETLELWPEELALLLLEELAALVELVAALVPEALPVLAALLVLRLALLREALELAEAALLRLVVADDEREADEALVVPPHTSPAGWQKLSARQQVVLAISLQSKVGPGPHWYRSCVLGVI